MTGRKELTAINVQPGLNEFFLRTEKKNVTTFSFSSGPDPVTSLCRSTQSEKQLSVQSCIQENSNIRISVFFLSWDNCKSIYSPP